MSDLITRAHKIGYRDGQKGEPWNERNKEYALAIGSIGVDYKRGFDEGYVSVPVKKGKSK